MHLHSPAVVAVVDLMRLQHNQRQRRMAAVVGLMLSHNPLRRRAAAAVVLLAVGSMHLHSLAAVAAVAVGVGVALMRLRRNRLRRVEAAVVAAVVVVASTRLHSRTRRVAGAMHLIRSGLGEVAAGKCSHQRLPVGWGEGCSNRCIRQG